MTDPALLERFHDVLNQLFVDNTEEEVLALWRLRVQQTPAWAQRALVTFDAVAADPPPDLREQLEEHGWISLYHTDDPRRVDPYTAQETVAWLREMTARLRAQAA